MLESVCNVAIGYAIAVATQAVVFPWFGIHITGGQDAEMAAVFTVVSLCRSYLLRRVFTRLTETRAEAYQAWMRGQHASP